MPVTWDTTSCTEQLIILPLLSTGLMVPLKTQKYSSPGSTGGSETGENVKFI